MADRNPDRGQKQGHGTSDSRPHQQSTHDTTAENQQYTQQQYQQPGQSGQQSPAQGQQPGGQPPQQPGYGHGGGGGDNEGLIDRLPTKEGGIFGAIAFVVGFVITYLFVEIDDEVSIEDGEEIGAGTFDLVGWVFYNTHFVDTVYSVDGAEEFGDQFAESERLIAEASTDIPEVLYYLIPIVVLIGAGYWVAKQVTITDEQNAAMAGASVIVGYFPLAVVGTFIFSHSEEVQDEFFDFSFSISPDTGMAIILAGIVYPLIFGAIGGYLLYYQENN